MKPLGLLLGVLLVGITAFGVWYWLKDASFGDIGGHVVNSPAPTPAVDTPPPDEGEVAGVVDAITIRLTSGHIIRYLGVKAPDAGKQVECFGRESLAANESIIGEHVRMESDPVLTRSRDGAWVRYVFFTPRSEATNDQASMTNSHSSPNDQNPTASPSPTADSKEIFVNERILEGGFGFPVVSQEMKYGERLLSAAKYASATGKGLWGRCEPKEVSQGVFETQPITECVIKGKVSGDQKFYRVPECSGYGSTMVLSSEGGQWFCSEDEAKAAGFVRAPDCSQ